MVGWVSTVMTGVMGVTGFWIESEGRSDSIN